MKLISGGQTGADRVALDVAIGLGLRYGGWVPKGGRAEDFPDAPGLLGKYPNMRETETSESSARTKLNVRDSGATLVLVTASSADTSPGTLLTAEAAAKLARRHLIVRVDEPHAAPSIVDWLRDLGHVEVLNVAGPRESEAPDFMRLAATCSKPRSKPILSG